MTVLPIVERELRVASRRWGTWWFRFAAALATVVLGGWMMWVDRWSSPSMIARATFSVMTTVVFVYALLAGVGTTAASISVEKREGTLGLLFLTDLKGYDVALGKLAASSLNAFYGLLGVLPMLAIPLLAGGVAGSDFLKMSATALNNLWFSLTAGLFVSSLSRDDRNASAGTVLLLIFFCFGCPALDAWIGYALLDRTTFPVLCSLFSPFYMCVGVFSTQPYFLHSWAAVHALGCVWLLSACWVLPRCWQERPARNDEGWRTWWNRFRFGGPERRKRHRRRMLDANPYYWLTARYLNAPIYVMLVLALGGLLWLWGYLKNRPYWLDEEMCVITGLTLHTLLKGWVAIEAPRQLAEDRRSGTLELLLTAPLQPGQIVRGQLGALSRQFGLPVLLTLLIDWLFMSRYADEGEWVFLCVAGMIVFVADLFTLSFAGMWFALRTGNARRATATAMFWVLLFPWILFIALMTMGVLSSSIDAGGAIAMWLVISLMVDLVCGNLCATRLRHSFRQVAEVPPGQKRLPWVGPPPSVQPPPPSPPPLPHPLETSPGS